MGNYKIWIASAFATPYNDEIERFYFLQKPKVAKTFDLWVDSLKVSESQIIQKSQKWILRYAQYDWVFRFTLDSYSIRKANRNRSNGGGALRYFGAK